MHDGIITNLFSLRREQLTLVYLLNGFVHGVRWWRQHTVCTNDNLTDVHPAEICKFLEWRSTSEVSAPCINLLCFKFGFLLLEFGLILLNVLIVKHHRIFIAIFCRERGTQRSRWESRAERSRRRLDPLDWSWGLSSR